MNEKKKCCANCFWPAILKIEGFYLYCQDEEKGTFTILPYEKDMYEHCCEKFKTRESWQDLVRL